MKTEHLLDSLTEATISAPTSDYVSVQRLTIGRETRTGLFQHPPAQVLFPPLRLGTQPILYLGYGIKEAAWSRIRSAVHFEVAVVDARDAAHLLLQATVDPGRNPGDRRWWDHAIELVGWEGRIVRLRLTTSLAGEDASYAWAGWSELRLEHKIPVAPPPRRRDPHRHAILITADALRRDHLGCYGHGTMKTPHLDRIAADGCVFLDARTQSTSTLGSYATTLTGRFPQEHGVLAEWGELRPGMEHLPRHLARRGYHTVMAFSESELSQPETGLPPMFDEVLPCLGRPAQSGDVTARAFRRWLGRRPDRPFFAWLQFFDAHPPCLAPEPFRSLYYQGDPSDPTRRHYPAKVAGVGGVESVADLRWELARPAGEPIDSVLVERLQATAEVLAGRRGVGPDLAHHLLAIGPTACRGMERGAFGAWLSGEVQRLRAGVASPALRDWLRSMLQSLLDVEQEILGWLRGVQDFRYPLAQYMSQVSHLDHHVGSVLDALREHDLYEQTLIVFTAPHGEILDQAGIVFDHHSLTEDVLRVPLLIKPGAAPGPRPGTRLAGVCDSIDLVPTLLSALELPYPPGLPGTDRWPDACQAPESRPRQLRHRDVRRDGGAHQTPLRVLEGPGAIPARRGLALDSGTDGPAALTRADAVRGEPRRRGPSIADSLDQRLTAWCSRMRDQDLRPSSRTEGVRRGPSDRRG